MIKLIDVSKTYKPKRGKKTVSLNNISFELPETGFVFILGKSGSGKSTLLNLIGSLDVATTGSIWINDKDLKKFKEKERNLYRNSYIGFIFQDYNLIENYNVYKNIELALNLQKRKLDKEIIIKSLEQVGIEKLALRKVSELSGGEKQRVAIARALVKNTKIILADEPTGNLDSENSKQIFEILKNISKEKLVIVVTHDIDSTNIYADRIIELVDGKIVNDKTLNDSFNESNEITLKKPKLSFLKSLPYALANLKKRKAKVFITSLLVTIAFSCLAFTLHLTKFDISKSHAETMVRENTTRVTLNKNIIGKDLNENIHPALSFTQTELNSTLNKLDDNYVLVSKAVEDNTYLQFDFPMEVENKIAYYNLFPDTLKFLEYTDNLINNLNIIGNLAEKENEVIISKVLADYIIRNGINSYDTDKKGNQIITTFKPNNYEEIINSNRKIISMPQSLDGAYLIITGIIDEDMSKYEELKNVLIEDIEIKPNKLYNEYKAIYEKKINELIVRKDFFDTFKSHSNEYLDGSLYKTKITYSDKYFYESNINTFNIEILNRIKENVPDFNVYPINQDGIMNINNLKDDEIILPFTKIFDLNDDLENYNLSYNSYMKEKQDEYNKKVKEREEKIKKEEEKAQADEDYIIKNIPEIKPLDYKKLTLDFQIDYIKKIDLIGKTVTIEINDLYNKILKDPKVLNLKIVGFQTDYSFTFVSKSNIDELLRNNHEVVSIYFDEENEEKLEKIFEEFPSNNASVISKTIYTPQIKNIENIIGKVEKVSLYLSIGLLVFTMILLSNFMVTSIGKNKKDIGILRALGARKLDVYKVFYLENFIISIISMVMSTLLCYIGIIFANNLIARDLFFKIKPIHFNIVIIFSIFIIILMISIISSMIPMYKISKLKPVDAIYDK